MKWKNKYYSVKEILASNPIPYNWKYNNRGELIKNHQRNWCKKIIRQIGNNIRKMVKK